jgi:hypothetical protein
VCQLGGLRQLYENGKAARSLCFQESVELRPEGSAEGCPVPSLCSQSSSAVVHNYIMP